MSVMDTARRRATRARLVDAAVLEFGRNGIDATSVEQVCEAAGFSRGAFYSNFSTKDDLCIEIARHTAQETAARVHEVLANMPERMTPDEIVPAILDDSGFTPELLNTRVELSLRAARDAEFAERLQAARVDVWPLYIEVAEQAAARAGVRFIVPVQDAIEVIESVYSSASQIGAADNARRLIMLVAQHLVAPVDEGEEQ